MRPGEAHLEALIFQWKTGCWVSETSELLKDISYKAHENLANARRSSRSAILEHLLTACHSTAELRRRPMESSELEPVMQIGRQAQA